MLDNQMLLKTITKAQNSYFKNEDPMKIFDAMLNTLLILTGSEYGFIGEILLDTTTNQRYLKTFALTNIAWSQETLAFYQENAPKGLEFRNNETLFGAVIKTGIPIIANDPANNPHASGIPEGHPPLNAFLGLPFHSGGEFVGMVGIANREQGYSSEIAEALEPFLATCANIINSIKTNRQKLSLDRLKDEFISTVSHELRTPLTSIIGSLGIMAEKENELDSATRTKLLTIARQNSDDMLAIINDLLDLQKYSSLGFVLDKSYFNLIELIDTHQQKILPQCKTRGINIVFNKRDNEKEFVVLADQARIGQVITNLLSNAIKFSPDESQIEVSCETLANEEFQISIRDFGCGIKEEFKSRVFNRFSQENNSTSRSTGGTGLGLAITKQIVDLHKGEIWFESDPGSGSTFYFRIPQNIVSKKTVS